jgi:hypothetical protein
MYVRSECIEYSVQCQYTHSYASNVALQPLRERTESHLVSVFNATHNVTHSGKRLLLVLEVYLIAVCLTEVITSEQAGTKSNNFSATS